MIDTMRQREDDNYIDRENTYTEDEYFEVKDLLEETENKLEEAEDKLKAIKKYCEKISEQYKYLNPINITDVKYILGIIND